MTPSLGTLPIDLAKLLETRLLVQANSGGGKSWALRRLLEQTAPTVQQIVIDPEGEFASLREKFDYIICAPRDADAVANPHTAAALARAIWESGTSAIVDIYELKAHERTLFVRRFLESLINAPKSIWNPAMVVIDEIHMFAPQSGQSESTSAVIDLATRGRKRGLALVGCTQRLSKLHKDVAAELLNKLIGRTGLDVDVARAADELGMTRADAMAALRPLDPGTFYAFGPALTRTVERTTIGTVQTTHPKTGARGMKAPPPPSKAVLAKLQKLEGIQREAEAEVRTMADLSKELTDVRRKLTIAEKRTADAGVPEAEVQRRVREAVAALPAAGISAQALKAVATAIAALQEIEMSSGAAPVPRAKKVASAPLQREPAAAPAPHDIGKINGDLKAPEQRIVDAIAWWAAAGVASPTRHQVAFVAGYTVNGHFNNQCGTLRSRGIVDYPGGGTLSLQEAGKHLANSPDHAPTRADLVSRVLGVLRGEPMRRIFAILAERGAMPRDELAQAAGYTVNGHFNNIVGSLNGIGVAEYPIKGVVGLTSIFSGLEAA